MLPQREDTKSYLIDTVYVTVAFIIIIFVLCTLENVTGQTTNATGKSILSQSGKWYRICIQDKNPIYALQHVDYAIAYLNAARHISSDVILEKGSGIDLHKYHNKLLSRQLELSKIVHKTKGKMPKNLSSQASWITS